MQASVETGAIVLFLDADTGTPDGFSAVPADPACTGTRGQGTWTDCGAGVATGSVI